MPGTKSLLHFLHFTLESENTNLHNMSKYFVLPDALDEGTPDHLYLRALLPVFQTYEPGCASGIVFGEILDAFPVLSLTKTPSDPFYCISVSRLEKFAEGEIPQDEMVNMGLKHLAIHCHMTLEYQYLESHPQTPTISQSDWKLFELLHKCMLVAEPVLCNPGSVCTEMNCAEKDLARYASYIPTEDYPQLIIVPTWIDGALHYKNHSILFFMDNLCGAPIKQNANMLWLDKSRWNFSNGIISLADFSKPIEIKEEDLYDAHNYLAVSLIPNDCFSKFYPDETNDFLCSVDNMSDVFRSKLLRWRLNTPKLPSGGSDGSGGSGSGAAFCIKSKELLAMWNVHLSSLGSNFVAVHADPEFYYYKNNGTFDGRIFGLTRKIGHSSAQFYNLVSFISGGSGIDTETEEARCSAAGDTFMDITNPRTKSTHKIKLEANCLYVIPIWMDFFLTGHQTRQFIVGRAWCTQLKDMSVFARQIQESKSRVKSRSKPKFIDMFMSLGVFVMDYIPALRHTFNTLNQLDEWEMLFGKMTRYTDEPQYPYAIHTMIKLGVAEEIKHFGGCFFTKNMRSSQHITTKDYIYFRINEAGRLTEFEKYMMCVLLYYVDRPKVTYQRAFPRVPCSLDDPNFVQAVSDVNNSSVFYYPLDCYDTIDENDIPGILKTSCHNQMVPNIETNSPSTHIFHKIGEIVLGCPYGAKATTIRGMCLNTFLYPAKRTTHFNYLKNNYFFNNLKVDKLSDAQIDSMLPKVEFVGPQKNIARFDRHHFKNNQNIAIKHVWINGF